MYDALMQIYHTANVDTPEYFRAELSQFMPVTRSTIIWVINARWVITPCTYPSEGECVRSCTTRPILRIFFKGIPYHRVVPAPYGTIYLVEINGTR